MAEHATPESGLLVSGRRDRVRRLGAFTGRTMLFLTTSVSTLAVLFIFYFIARDALPFFYEPATGLDPGILREFFTSTEWYPSAEPGRFGALSILYGSGLVTSGAIVVVVPLGVAAAVCLSDILPFSWRQVAKPVIEILAAIPSVAYGFFALVVLAPLLQERGGGILAGAAWTVLLPLLILGVLVFADLAADRVPGRGAGTVRALLWVVLGGAGFGALWAFTRRIGAAEIASGANALNVSLVLGIMALPTVVSVSEDALQAVGRDLREGSYALGATRAETILLTVLPAALSGICAAVILGLMRAIGETMVVWMASGNAAQIATPWYNLLAPVRTLTATIAGDMGEADQVTGSRRYHVLFLMAFCLLVVSFAMNLASEYIVRKQRRRTGKEA